MMSRLYKIFIVALLSLAIFIQRAEAITKLEFTDPISEMSKKIQKVYEEIEEKYTETVEKLNGKIRQAVGGEGASLFNKFVLTKSPNLVLNGLRGQFNVGDLGLNGLSNTMLSQYGNLKLDLANMLTYTTDMAKSLENEKLEKTKMIHVELSGLYSEREILKDLLAKSPENAEEIQTKLKDIEIGIANLEGQSEKILAENVLENSKITESQKTIDLLGEQINNFNTQKVSADLLKSLNTATANLFATKDNDDTADVYATNINRLFLGKYDYEGGDNLSKIIKARQQEYYEAVKNLGREYLNTLNDVEKSAERSQSCADGLEMPDGIDGQQTMQICMDLQNARVAAGYAGILIAQLRFKAISDIQSWNHMYKLRSYDADPTKFNLDNYIFKKENLNFNASSAISNFKGF